MPTRQNRITFVLLFISLFIGEVRAQNVQEAFLPAFRRGRNLYDFESGELIDLLVETMDEEEFFRQLQKLGDLYYTSRQGRRGKVILTSGVYNLMDDSIFESNKIYPVRQQKLGAALTLDHLKDKYVILQTRKEKKVAMHVLGISKMRLHICWILTDPKIGRFSEDDKRELIDFVKSRKPSGKPVSGETTIYNLHGPKADGFYFGDQNTTHLKYPKYLTDKEKLKQLSNEELLQLYINRNEIINEVDVSYESSTINFPGGSYLVPFGQLNDLPQVVKNTVIVRQSIVKPLLSENNVFLIKTVDAKYALIKIQSFDSKKLTFSWFYQPDGTMNFPSEELKSGAWDPPKPKAYELSASLIDIYRSQNISLQEKMKLIKKTVDRGADINMTSGNANCSLLHHAVQSGSVEFVRLLISLGANVNQKSITGSVSLHSTAQTGKLEICEILLDHGADPSIVNNDGNTPLRLAIQKPYPRKNDKVIELLRSRTKPKTLFMASILCNEEAIKELIEKGLNPNEYDALGYTPLHHAVENKCARVCELLIKNGGKPDLVRKKDKSHKTALGQAAFFKETEIVRLMVENYSFSKKDLSMALLESSYSGDSDSCKFLFSKGADPFFSVRNHYRTPHFIAMRFGSKEVVDVYIQHGIAMPLWAAVRLEMIDEVKKQLLAGADASSMSEEGYPVLYYAIVNRNLEIVQLLLERQPELDQIIKRDGLTLLHLAINKKYPESAQLLIKYGCNVNLKDSINRTPLCMAVEMNDIAVTKMLLEYGADQTIVPRGRPSLIGYAKQKNRNKIYKLLKRYKK